MCPVTTIIHTGGLNPSPNLPMLLLVSVFGDKHQPLEGGEGLVALQWVCIYPPSFFFFCNTDG